MTETRSRFFSKLGSNINSSGEVTADAISPAVTQSLGTSVYDSASQLPSSGFSAGDTAFVKSTSRLYINSGFGWYNVAVINNTPTVQSILDDSNNTTPFTLSSEGLSTTITVTAQDSDGDALTYSAIADSDFNTMATISQASNVFTITPFGQDSAVATSGTITFSVTDGINIATPPAQTFGLSFEIVEPELGTFMEGGYYGGLINVEGTYYYLIVSPKASGYTSGKALSNTSTLGISIPADRFINGPDMTSRLVSINSPAAVFCNNLTINGYSDWYLPARYEMEILYFNLKPTAEQNSTDPNTGGGINPYAVPPRDTIYTAGFPARTTVSLFQDNNAQSLKGASNWTSNDRYWTSSPNSSSTAYDFIVVGVVPGASANNSGVNGTKYVRAIRRVLAS